MRRPASAAVLPLLLAACGAASSPVATGGPTAAATLGTSAAASAAPATATANPYSNSGAPPARTGFALGYDPASKRLLMISGGAYHPNAEPGPPDTLAYAWDGTSWTKLDAAAPSADSPYAVVDPSSGRLCTVAGDPGATAPAPFEPQPELYCFDGSGWQRVTQAPVSEGVNLAVDPDHGQVVLTAGGPTGAGVQPPSYAAPGEYVWDGHTWTPLQSGGLTTLEANGAGIAWDPISHRVIQFGGTQQYALPDTWAWDGTGWRMLSVATRPTPGPARAATDATSGQVLLLTMGVENQDRAATWTWDGSNWHRHVADHAPPAAAVTAGSLAFDPGIGRVVLVAPAAGSSTTQMWIWTGSDWDQLPG